MTTRAAGEAAKKMKKFQLPNSSTSDESLPSDDELDFMNERYEYSDELPTFDIRSISPTGRSPSPIDRASSFLNDSLSEMCLSPSSSPCREEDDFADFADMIPLRDIDAQINSPAHQPNRNLETIFEGVFLETPPKKTDSWRVDLAQAVVRKSLTNLRLDNVEKSAQDSSKARRSLSAVRDLV